MRRIPTFAAALLLGALLAGPALAEVKKLPKEGRPALTIDVPTGWAGAYDDQGNLLVTSNDRSSVIMLAWVTGDEAPLDLDTLAARILAAAQAKPYSAKEPGVAAGMSGEAYLAILPINGIDLRVRETLFRLDQDHVGVVVTLEQPVITSAQTASLRATLSLVGLEK